MPNANIGLIGLAVMGQNLVLNLERNGFTVAVYNRTTATMQEFVDAHPGKKLVPAPTLEDFVASLERPRRILIMVKAGGAVDAVIDQLVPLLEKGDLIMDGGSQVDLLEIKAGQTIAADFFTGLDKLRTLLPNAKRRLLVYGGERAFRQHDTQIVPWKQAGITSIADTSV